jgi:diguanylate cyclase (GGDEF)-like protein
VVQLGPARAEGSDDLEQAETSTQGFRSKFSAIIWPERPLRMGLLHGDGDASIPGYTIQRRAGSLEPQRREPLLFVDLDGLKDINDRHGHRAGSMALRKAARVIRSELRETDVAARWGGDEFTLIAQKTGAETGMALADRIRRRIADRMAAWPLTVSVGVATADLQNTAALEPTALLREADLAMYEAKKRGKNSTFHIRTRRSIDTH